MAQQDFVNKKRVSKAKKEAKKPFPVLATVVAVALVSLSGYGLYYITSNSKVQETSTTKSVKASAVTTQKPKPVEPKFIEEIKNTELDVEVTEMEQKGPWRLQCASLRNEDDAQSLKAEIAIRTGMIATVNKSDGSNGIWYRVRVEPFDTKRLAESANNKMKQGKLPRCRVYLIPQT